MIKMEDFTFAEDDDLDDDDLDVSKTPDKQGSRSNSALSGENINPIVYQLPHSANAEEFK